MAVNVTTWPHPGTVVVDVPAPPQAEPRGPGKVAADAPLPRLSTLPCGDE